MYPALFIIPHPSIGLPQALTAPFTTCHSQICWTSPRPSPLPLFWRSNISYRMQTTNLTLQRCQPSTMICYVCRQVPIRTLPHCPSCMREAPHEHQKPTPQAGCIQTNSSTVRPDILGLCSLSLDARLILSLIKGSQYTSKCKKEATLRLYLQLSFRQTWHLWPIIINISKWILRR